MTELPLPPNIITLLQTVGMLSALYLETSPFSVEVTGSPGVPLQECGSSAVCQSHRAGTREFQMWGDDPKSFVLSGKEFDQIIFLSPHEISYTKKTDW